MRAATIDSLLLQIETSLRRKSDIFVQDMTHIKPERFPESDESDKNGKTGYKITRVYWPRYTGKFSHAGYTLKHDMGTVALEVIYRHKEGDKRSYSEIAHSFRYFNTDHTYSFRHKTHAKVKEVSAYSFRYDKDRRESAKNDPEEHMQVMEHAVPRFILKDSSLDDFLNLVKQTCYQLNEDNQPSTIVSSKVGGFFDAAK